MPLCLAGLALAGVLTFASPLLAQTDPAPPDPASPAPATPQMTDTLTVVSNPPVCVTPPSGIVGWWPGNGNASDIIGGNPGIPQGGITYTSGIVGQAFNFDGIDDAIIIPASSNLTVQSLTIEAWIIPDVAHARPIVEFAAATGSAGVHLWVSAGPGYALPPGNLYANLLDSTGQTNHLLISPSGLVSGQAWSHVALTYDQASGMARLYLNGAIVAGTNFGTFTPKTALPVNLGYRPVGSADILNGSRMVGLMDEVTIYNRALTPAEIAAIYNAGSAGKCPPPPACTPAPSGLVSWWPLQGNAQDAADSNSGLVSGNPVFSAGEVGQAMQFDFVDDQVRVPASPSLNVGKGIGMTIEGWINPAVAWFQQPLVEWNDNHGTVGAHFWISVSALSGGPGSLWANLMDTNGTAHQISSASGIVRSNVFQHVALTYDKTSGLAKLFYNGAVVAQSSLGTFTAQTSVDLYFALRPSGVAGGNRYMGAMDEMSLYSRALTPTEIQLIYNAGSAGKCLAGEPPHIMSQPQNQTVNLGDNVAFSVTATGTTPLSYQWLFNGQTYASPNSNQLILTSVQASMAGGYSVVVTNPFGAATSMVATLVVTNPAPICVNPPTGLVSWWPGEGNALDAAGTNNGTLAGNAAFGQGQVGQGFVFDGHSGAVRVGNPASLQLQNFTIEAWIKRADTSLVTYHFSHLGFIFGYGWNGYGFGLYNDGTLFFTKVGVDNVLLPAGLTDTNFHHVAVTKSGSTMVFYIDGVAHLMPAYNSVFQFQTTAAIGSPGNYDLTDSFLGTIDEVSVYNRALTAAEIQAIYSADGAGKCMNGIPPQITSQPQNRTVNVGDNVTFSVTATGTSPLSYQWLFNGQTYASPNSNQLMLASVQTAMAGGYSVVVTNGFGAVTSAVATLTVNTNPPVCVSPPAGLVSWWRAEGDPGDAADGNNGTIAGTVTYSPGLAGKAFVFDGTHRDRVNLGNPANLQLEDFTIEAWVKRSSATVSSFDVLGADGSVSGNGGVIFGYGRGGYGFGILNGGQLFLSRIDVDIVSSAPLVTDTNWHHLAVTKSGSNAVFYVDGASQATPAYNHPAPYTFDDGTCACSAAAAIGSRGDARGGTFYGMIDEVAVYQRPLVAAEIQSIYNAGSAGKCPPPHPCTPAPPGLVSWWPGDMDARDRVGPNHGSLVGGVTIAPGKVGNGFAFDGTGYVIISNNPTLSFSNELSIELWYKSTQSNDVYYGIIGKRGTTTVNYGINVAPSGIGLGVYYEDPLVRDGDDTIYGSGAEVSRYSPAPGPGVFHHLGATYKQVGTNQVRLETYLDGQLVRTKMILGNLARTLNTEPVTIGASNPNWELFKGVIDEVSIYNRVLSSTEIQAIYNADGAGKCLMGSPPQIVTQPQSQSVSLGNNVTISIVATGSPPLVYQWWFAGQPLAGAISDSLTLNNVQANLAGDYFAMVMNAFGAMTSAVATLTVNTNPPVCVKPPSGLVSWWQAEDNALDAAGTNNGTLAGNTTFGQGRAGQGFVFDGHNGAVQVGNPANLQLQDLTIEAWIKRASTSVITLHFSHLGYIFGYGWNGYGFGLYNDGTLFFTKVGVDNVLLPAGLTDTNFHHVAVTKSGSTVVIYIDGVAHPMPSYNSVFQFQTTAAIGSPGNYDLTDSFLGMIDEVSIYNRALSASEIQAIYSADGAGKCPLPPFILHHPQNSIVDVGDDAVFGVTAAGTPPLSYQWLFNGLAFPSPNSNQLVLPSVQTSMAGGYSVVVTSAFGSVTSVVATLTVLSNYPGCVDAPLGLVSWWPFEGNAVDVTHNNSGIVFGNPAFGAGEVGQAIKFDFTDDYVRVPASPSLNVGREAGLTIEGWIKPAVASFQQPLVEWNNTHGSVGTHFWIGVRLLSGGPDSLWANLVDTNGTTHPISSGQGVLKSNIFQHVAVTYDKVSGNSSLYHNGVIVGQTNLGTFTPQTGFDMFFGYRPSGVAGGNSYMGAMDEMSLYNRALSPAEIHSIASAGSAGKCLIPRPPLIIDPPQDQTVSVETDVTFAVLAAGTPPLYYQWAFNDVPILGATSANLLLPHVVLSASGNYSVTVSNSEGTVASHAELTVLDNMSPTIVCATNKQVECGTAWSFDDPVASDESSPVTVSVVSTITNGLCGNTFRAIRTWQAADASGNTARCRQMVIVVDTTPPRIFCPTNIVVEFLGLTGAVATFTATASDLCSDVTIACVPPSGSLLPIGGTNVTCTATDACGNAASCSFTVTVRGARGMLQDVLAELTALRAGDTNRDDAAKLDDVLHHLTGALEAWLWLDENHVSSRNGDQVFNKVKGAVHDLEELMKAKKSQLDDALLQGFIDRLLKAARLLAEVSIQDAMNAGANARKVAEDKRELAKGDEEWAKGHFEAALDHYRNAWKHAVHLHLVVNRAANGSVQLEFVGLTGDTWAIQASSNLVDWVTLGTVKANVDGDAVFDDSGAATATWRFYRVVTP